MSDDKITTTIGDHQVQIEQKDDGIYIVHALLNAKEHVIAEALKSGSTLIKVKDTIAGVEITLKNDPLKEETKGETDEQS